MAALAALATFVSPAAAQDKVKVGVFPVSSTLPYFVAVERGFFKEQNIEPEMVRLIGGPPNVAAMITNQIDASAVLVTIEGMNADLKKPPRAQGHAVVEPPRRSALGHGSGPRPSRRGLMRRGCRAPSAPPSAAPCRSCSRA